MNKPLYKRGQPLTLSKKDGADTAVVLNVLKIKEIPDLDDFIMLYYDDIKDEVRSYKTRIAWEVFMKNNEDDYIYELLLGSVKGYLYPRNTTVKSETEDYSKSFITVAGKEKSSYYIEQRSQESKAKETYDELFKWVKEFMKNSPGFTTSFRPPQHTSTQPLGIEPIYSDTYVRRVDFRSKLNTPIQGRVSDILCTVVKTRT